MTDYTIFYKEELPVDEPWPKSHQWHIFISAYNSSERVRKVFDIASADKKYWLILPDYMYADAEVPLGAYVNSAAHCNESDFILGFIDSTGQDFREHSICIDITGFIKPYAMFLIMRLFELGIRRFDVIYSEPSFYSKKEETLFSDEEVFEVRQVAGFEGVHDPDTSHDLMIVGVGYDHELIAHVANDKEHTSKMQVFGFPPLQADMYQENVLRAQRSAEAVGVNNWRDPHNILAPANDPFVTATVLSRTIASERAKRGVTNLYLCPLSTEAQALGFALYYITECRYEPVSVIYPFCRSYSKSTSTGTSRIWKYTVELPENAHP